MELELFFSWLRQYHSDTVDDPAMLKEIFMDDEAFAGAIIQTAVQAVDQYRSVIDNANISTDDKNFYLAVHSLKSTAASIGMKTMATIFRRVETSIRNGETITNEQRKNLQVYTGTIRHTVQQMDKLLNSNE